VRGKVRAVSVVYTSRTGKQYYLHMKTTAARRPSYFFSTDGHAPLAEAVPDGYEVFENVRGQVFLRKKTVAVIHAEELSLVEQALRQHGEPWRYIVEVKKKSITIHEAGDMAGLDGMVRELGGRALSDEEKRSSATYMAVMRFTLADRTGRTFVAERFCFRGSVDDWIPIAGPDALSAHLRRFVKHLGRDSFYELH
jgi:hypothetical protein